MILNIIFVCCVTLLYRVVFREIMIYHIHNAEVGGSSPPIATIILYQACILIWTQKHKLAYKSTS